MSGRASVAEAAQRPQPLVTFERIVGAGWQTDVTPSAVTAHS